MIVFIFHSFYHRLPFLDSLIHTLVNLYLKIIFFYFLRCICTIAETKNGIIFFEKKHASLNNDPHGWVWVGGGREFLCFVFLLILNIFVILLFLFPLYFFYFSFTYIIHFFVCFGSLYNLLSFCCYYCC